MRLALDVGFSDAAVAVLVATGRHVVVRRAVGNEPDETWVTEARDARAELIVSHDRGVVERVAPILAVRPDPGLHGMARGAWLIAVADLLATATPTERDTYLIRANRWAAWHLAFNNGQRIGARRNPAQPLRLAEEPPMRGAVLRAALIAAGVIQPAQDGASK